MIRAYLFALDPTEAQEQAFRSHCGAQRYAYNFGLALIRANLEQRAAERSYGIAEDDLTPSVSWSAYSLRRAWNQAKRELAPWWAENSKEAYSCGLANLATALGNWSSSASGQRAGPKVAFPRFKGRRARLACRFTTGAVGLGPDRRYVRLPRIGLVRTHESTRKLSRRIDAASARIRSATLSWQRGRWHVSLSVELPDPNPVQRTGGRVVGVDLGIKSLAVLSTGEVVPNPRHLQGALRGLRRAQRTCSRRRGPDRRTHVEPIPPVAQGQGAGQRPAHAGDQLPPRWAAQAHHRAGHRARHDRHRRPERRRDGPQSAPGPAPCGLGMGEFRRQIEYKAPDAGTRVVVADRWYPSSKTCSACGAVRAKLTLAERQFVCESCGTRLDRDLNAAMNLAALANQALSGELRPEVKRPAGNPRQTATGGNGYRYGKTQTMSQRRPREVATP